MDHEERGDGPMSEMGILRQLTSGLTLVRDFSYNSRHWG
jgi:hypothetical protein